MTATDQQIEQRYKDNLQTYSTPEQIRASHILFKTEGKDDAAVKKLAESVLAKVKAGGDFAALAKQYSEDDSAKNGGDLELLQPRRDGEGVRRRRVEAERRPGERPRQVAVRLPHHQAHG